MAGLLISAIISLTVCNFSKDLDLVRTVADSVVSRYNLAYVVHKDGKIVSDPTSIPYDSKSHCLVPSVDWSYSNGIINSALLDLYAVTGESKYLDYVRMHVKNCFINYPLFHKTPGSDIDWNPFSGLRKFNELDFVGTQCAALIRLQEKEGTKEYEDWIQRAAEHIRSSQARLADGTLVRKKPKELTLWADDLYMGLSLMSLYSETYDDDNMRKDAVMQVMNFNRYLWDRHARLFWHAWYSDTESQTGAFWGRCNGWILKATGELLDVLTPGTKDFRRVRRLFRRQVRGLIRYQDADGMFHQVLNNPESYKEASCTVIFAGTIAHAVAKGWIGKKYAGNALSAWETICKDYIREGALCQVCIGTGIQSSEEGYIKRPYVDGENHGIGLLLKSGLQIIELKQCINKFNQ